MDGSHFKERTEQKGKSCTFLSQRKYGSPTWRNFSVSCLCLETSLLSLEPITCDHHKRFQLKPEEKCPLMITDFFE